MSVMTDMEVDMREPLEVAEEFWEALPTYVREQILEKLPRGAVELGHRRKGQRYYLGQVEQAGKLVGWTSSSDPADRNKKALVWCARCDQVGFSTMKHYLSGRNRSCGCRATDNRVAILASKVESLGDNLSEELASNVIMGLTRKQIAHRHRGSFAMRQLGTWFRYVLTRNHKLWLDRVWSENGSDQMMKIATCVARVGELRASRIFKTTIARVRACCIWIGKAELGTAPAMPAKREKAVVLDFTPNPEQLDLIRQSLERSDRELAIAVAA